MNLPGSLLPFIAPQFSDSTGVPLALGTIEFFVSGSTSTHKGVFSNPDLGVGHALVNPLTLGGDGRPPTAVYLAGGGYYVVVKDSAGVQVWAGEVEDIGQTFLAMMGYSLTIGTKGATAYYGITSTDMLVTVNGTGGVSPCPITLPPVSSRFDVVGVKNIGTVALSLLPNGADTIDGASGAFTVPAAAGGVNPTIWLAPDGVSNWDIVASHGVV